MPTRRGPGRPQNAWRPRKIEEDYLVVSEGRHKPTTRDSTVKTLRKWEDFLRERAVDSEAVTIHDLIAWEDALVAKGYTRVAALYNKHVRSYYLLKGSKQPDSRWSRIAAELKAHKSPPVIGRKHPHQPYPLDLLPKILEASKHVLQRDLGGKEIYSDAFAVTATLLYTGGRAQFYGLRDQEVRAALEKKYVEIFVKEGEEVLVPVHDRLLAIWKDHLDQRDFDGPQFFRHGRNPYTYQDGNKAWREDALASKGNDTIVGSILRSPAKAHGGGPGRTEGVEVYLERLYGIRERLTAHRFRKSVGTYMEAYGFTDSERRLQLSHGAKTITEQYSVADVVRSQEKLSKLDLGSADWVAAHNPPANLFAGNGGVDQDQVADLRAQLQRERDRNERLEAKLDELLERTKVIA